MRGWISVDMLPDGTVISKGSVVLPSEGYIPVFLPDKTEAGKAQIVEHKDGVFAQIEMGKEFKHLFEESLVGLSIVYMDSEAKDVVAEAAENKKENPDE